MKRISYNPLWKKLGRNENVTTAVLVKITEALDCGLTDIAEIVEVIESVKGDNDVKAH